MRELKTTLAIAILFGIGFIWSADPPPSILHASHIVQHVGLGILLVMGWFVFASTRVLNRCKGKLVQGGTYRTLSTMRFLPAPEPERLEDPALPQIMAEEVVTLVDSTLLSTADWRYLGGRLWARVKAEVDSRGPVVGWVEWDARNFQYLNPPHKG